MAVGSENGGDIGLADIFCDDNVDTLAHHGLIYTHAAPEDSREPHMIHISLLLLLLLDCALYGYFRD